MALVERVVQEARALGKPRLYLLHARFQRCVSQTCWCVAERTFYRELWRARIAGIKCQNKPQLAQAAAGESLSARGCSQRFLGSFRGDVFRLYHFRAASDH